MSEEGMKGWRECVVGEEKRDLMCEGEQLMREGEQLRCAGAHLKSDVEHSPLLRGRGAGRALPTVHTLCLEQLARRVEWCKRQGLHGRQPSFAPQPPRLIEGDHMAVVRSDVGDDRHA